MQQMLQQLLANKEKAEANRNADLENLEDDGRNVESQPRWPKRDECLQ
jgi:hypothetical protein